MYIVILDDEEPRQEAMLQVLGSLNVRDEIKIFDNAPDMIAWLGEYLSEVVLLSLDHDLGPNRQRNDEVFDPGTGRHVVDFLITQTPVCPVIVHTSNGDCAPGMMFALEYANWAKHRVVPYDGNAWIHQVWARAMKQYLSV
jgi:hypothetical protein